MANRMLNVFLGGGATPGVFNRDFQMFPSAVPDPCDACDLACHKAAPPVFLNRVLDTCPSSECDVSCGPDQAFIQYLKTLTDAGTPLAVGDCLGILILPKWVELTRLWFHVEYPAPGLTFQVQIRDLDLVLLPNLDAGLVDPCVDNTSEAEATGLIDLTALNGGDPLYLDRTDILDLEITGLPAEGVPCAGDNCFRLDIGVLAQPFCSGQF